MIGKILLQHIDFYQCHVLAWAWSFTNEYVQPVSDMAWSGNRCRVKQSIRLWRLQPFQIESLIPLQSGDFTTLPWEGSSKFPNKWVHERGSIESGLSRPGPASRILFITGSPQNRGDSNYIEGTGPLGSSEKGVPRFLTAPRDCLQSGKGLAPMMDTTT